MITRVKALNLNFLGKDRPGIELLLKTKPRLLEDHALISCVPTAIHLPDHPNWLRLDFADIRTEDEIPKDPSPAFEAQIFSTSQADRIIDFVGRQHNRPGKRVLFVNCVLGVSRSGAVATFVRDLFILDPIVFRKENPCVSASPMILNRLRKRWLEVH
ncbi:MAG: hypothetical protein K2W82_18320 [Candidatus Obscuribacterales bacterium]|jgi:hypothetical protein|nr:hypothetical protein [Candidatus Obscuribacterales bacterium]